MAVNNRPKSRGPDPFSLCFPLPALTQIQPSVLPVLSTTSSRHTPASQTFQDFPQAMGLLPPCTASPPALPHPCSSGSRKSSCKHKGWQLPSWEKSEPRQRQQSPAPPPLLPPRPPGVWTEDRHPPLPRGPGDDGLARTSGMGRTKGLSM